MSGCSEKASQTVLQSACLRQLARQPQPTDTVRSVRQTDTPCQVDAQSDTTRQSSCQAETASQTSNATLKEDTRKIKSVSNQFNTTFSAKGAG